MINFIICDDNEFFLMDICKIVDDFCVKKNINYKIYPFKSYNFEFIKKSIWLCYWKKIYKYKFSGNKIIFY